jgi:hypothetical protein
MNNKQKVLCIAGIVVILGMSIYPPYLWHGQAGIMRSQGYSWIFSPPTEGAMIDTAMLITQWIGVLIIGAITFLLLKDKP